MSEIEIILLAIIGVVLLVAAFVAGKIRRDAKVIETPEVIKTLDKTKKRPYSFNEYNPEWPTKFESIKELIVPIFGKKALAIEHVGSTSIPGMKAKPIIDVLVTISKMESFTREKALMKSLGYEWGDNYIAPGTIVFFKENPDGSKTENIHVCERGSPKALQFIYMRDYFRAHPEKAKDYGDLKMKLKQEHPHDYPAYRQGKKAFLDEIEHFAHEWMREQK